jgi:hypothetical protein
MNPNWPTALLDNLNRADVGMPLGSLGMEANVGKAFGSNSTITEHDTLGCEFRQHALARGRNLMRSFGLKFAIVLFAVLLGWTSVEAETCTRLLKRVCLSDPTCTTEYCHKVACKDRWERCM